MTTNSTTPEMLDSFLAEAWDTVGTLERAVEYLRAPAGFGSYEQLVIVSHRLKGSAGLYRYPEISRLGALLERVFECVPEFMPAQLEKAVQFAQLCAGCLTEALERIASTGEEGAVGFDLNRFGGPQLLSALVQVNPTAFAKTASNPEASEPQPTPEAPAPQPEPATTVVSLEDELRAFHAQDPEMWSYFAPEVQEHLESVGSSIESLLMSVVTGENPDDHIKALFRTMHTIKGAAYSVGCQPIGKLAHRLEDAMVQVRDGQTKWNQTLASTMIQGADTISLMLGAAEGKQTRLEASLQQTQSLLAQVLNEPDLELFAVKTVAPESKPIETAAQAAPATEKHAEPEAKAEARATLRVSLDRLESLMDLTGETVIARGRFERLVKRYEQLGDDLQGTLKRFERSALDFTERYLNPRLSNPELGEAAQQANNDTNVAPTIGRGRSATEVFSELEFDRYDDLNILARTVGEMANDLSELHTQYTNTTQNLSRETETLGKLTRNLRAEVSQMRLVPIGRLFSRVRRQARQLNAQKAFKLEVHGEDVEVDNVVLEGLADPLIHLLTNAVAHGLELPEDRKGKPAEGSISIRAFQRGNFVFVEVQDDGQGINVNKVREQAIARGLRSQEDVDRLNDEQAMELIFLPGLSTKDVVTEQAGRGVGMDAVWSSVRRLKGEVRIQSEPGLGTLVQLRVPLTLVVSDVLLFGAGGQTLAVARETVRALRAVPQDAITTFEGTPHVLLGAELIPLLEIEPALGLPVTTSGNLASIAVLEVGTDKLALRVASFLGLEQAVVRPLEEPLDRLSHLAGATVSSDGEVILVLDPLGLARLSDQPLSTPALELRRETATATAAPQAAEEAQMHILLVDDSLSVRRVVAQTLKRNGYLVTTAADGQEALELLAESRFDVVITDLEMPRLNGFELVEEIRRRRSLEGLPVAMLTSRASEKHAHLALELGVNEYLTKPLDESKLQRFLGSVRGQQKAMVTT